MKWELKRKQLSKRKIETARNPWSQSGWWVWVSTEEKIFAKKSFFYSTNEKIAFEPPFRALRGNVRTPSTARWKARGRLYIRRNWTFFAVSYGWDVMSGNRPKSAFFEGGCVTLSADFRGKGASPTNHCWYQSSRVIALSCGIKISAVRHLVLSQSTRMTDRQTDRRTDRQNYDSQDRPRICSRGKNYWEVTQLVVTEVQSESFGLVSLQSAVTKTHLMFRCVFIVECGMARFLYAMRIFEFRALSSSPRLALYQMWFLSRPPVLS